MACDAGFCNDYLVLRPEKGGLSDLFRLLFSKNIDNNRFLECPNGTEIRGVKRRWVICISLAVQVILLHLKKPMNWVGSTIEWWMNLLSENKNFHTLLINLLQGKLRIPDPKSASYKSYVGYLDERVGLDKNIKHEDSRYKAALSVMAAKLAYENQAFIESTVKDVWKMEFVEYYSCWNDYQELYSTQAFMFVDKSTVPELIVVSFRGTESFNADDWVTDVDFSFYDLPGMGRVHAGFLKALGLQKEKGWPKEIEQGGDRPAYAYYTIREKLRDILRENENAKFIVTGHSLGGALAILFPAILAVHDEGWMLDRMAGVYTFGQPRVGDKKLGEFLMDHFSKHEVSYYRFVYSNDIVPRVPYDDKTLWFKHFGACLYYNSDYKGKIMTEEPNKNYFWLWLAFPKYLNAVRELVRSFTIGYTRGPDYKEGWPLRIYRVSGLLIPGISAHAPQDYVNATRLGTSLVTMNDGLAKSSKLD